MEDKNLREPRLFYFLIFLIIGSLSLSIGMPNISNIIPDTSEMILRISITFTIFLITLVSKKNPILGIDWTVGYMFFVASLVQLIEWHFSGWLNLLLEINPNSPTGIAIDKLESCMIIFIMILLLLKVSRIPISVIYLNKGKIKFGLFFGLSTFIIFLIMSIPLSIILFNAENVSINLLFSNLPWLIILSISNAFMEELLFRGLFLKKFEFFLGATMANTVISIVFAIGHIAIDYSSSILIFFLILFSLSLAWGKLIQKTNSLLGSTLFHAGSDLPVFLGIISSLVGL
jgi:membrane protease YdiL (CAAX protease family)